MKTLLTRSPDVAAAFIKSGGIVAFPTETVYGLGGNIFDESAIVKIFEAKGRPQDNPLIAHIGHLGQLDDLAEYLTEYARKFIHSFFPGPLTIVVKKTKKVPAVATAGLDTIGIRMPGHDLAREFLFSCDTPVAAPSANISGRPSPTTWEAVLEDLDGRIDCILQGDATMIGLESTVVDCTIDVPAILRPGAISLEQLRNIVPATCMHKPSRDEHARSPGIKHAHYSPRAKAVIGVNPQSSDVGPIAFIGLRQPSFEFDLLRVCTSVEEYASELYEFFRRCDREGILTIYCQEVEEKGLGAALMDRIRRASA